jgi:hypothetical protein
VLAPSRLLLLLLLVLGAGYVVFCLLAQPGGGRPVNDEGALLAGARRLLDGGYADRRPGAADADWLWHGPGSPALLAPLVAVDAPLWLVRVVTGPVLLAAGVGVFARALLERFGPRLALAGTLALGLYLPLLHPLRTVHKEPLALLLVALALLAVVRRRWALAGLALGALAMVRLEYGWVLVALLACAAAAVVVGWRWPGRAGAWGRAGAIVAGVGLLACLPWLAYTRDVSGRALYWGSASGESLFWMSPTGVPGQTGEFHGLRPALGLPELAPVHPLLARVESLGPGARDRELQRVAMTNVRARPGVYVRNLAANAARLWFAVPSRPGPPAGTVVLFAGFGTALLVAVGWAAAVLWRVRARAAGARPRLPSETGPVVLFAALGLAVHLPPSADPRMTLPLVPVLLWLVVTAAEVRRARG